MSAWSRRLSRGRLGGLLRALAGARAAWREWRLQSRRRFFYRQFVRPGALCFDVGADRGNRTVPFLQLDARVVAIEPVAERAAALRRRFTGHPRLTVVQAAVGARETEAVLQVCSPSSLSTLSPEWLDITRRSARFPTRRIQAQRLVPVTTLDALSARFGRPDFIKIDVEGYELEVLRGLSRAVPALSFEYIPENLAAVAACLKQLEMLGAFEVNYSSGENLHWTLPAWGTPAELLAHLQAKAQAGDRQFGDIYVRYELQRAEDKASH